MKKTISILGSTGSIGTQCLDVCKQHGFKVRAITANNNIDLLEKQAREFLPEFAVTANESHFADLKTRLADLPVKVQAGTKAVEEVAVLDGVDTVLNAIMGIAGLRPTLAVLENGTDLALSNKEALIVGGELVMKTARENNAQILPVDSEHSAIWQSMRAGRANEVRKIFLTASGGPFFGKKAEELENVTVAQALAHPNWSMGSKITIDSATLMNKGLEFIEAIWLFDLRPEQIEIVVHRESVIHSAVEFVDGSVIAQLGVPDMRVPIQYALTYPERLPLDTKPLSLTDYGSFTFAKPDIKTFACLDTCIMAAKIGGLKPCIVNGANEKAVELFLNGKIGFMDIGRLVRMTFENIHLNESVNIDNLEAADNEARQFVESQIK